MYKNQSIIAIIPARGGSKRIPNKNKNLLAGKPLIAYTIEEAKKSKLIDKLIVSSDDEDILAIARNLDCASIERPRELAKDDSKTVDAMKHVLENCERGDNKKYDVIVLLQPTSPFRKKEIIDECITKLVNENLDSIETVKESSENPSLMFAINKNKMHFNDKASFFDKSKKKKYFILNGAVWATKRGILLKKGIYGDKNGTVMMDKDSSLEIDTPHDWYLAEKIMQEKISTSINKKSIKIDNKRIGTDFPVFIIAEAGVNHNGDIKLAKKLIDVAVEAKADAVKFQTFNVDKGTSKLAAKVDYQKKTTDKKESLYDMLKKLQLSKSEFRELRDYANKKGIIFLSTASDIFSADLLEELGVPAFKIGSPNVTNIPLLKHIAKFKKPIILSVGMATYPEIEETISAIKSKGNEEIALLHCVSNYPASFEEANLLVITSLKKRFPDIDIGYSDHTSGIAAAVASVALGATIIEKHITLDRNLPGPDHKASIEPLELKELITNIRNVKKALGDGIKKITEEEKKLSLEARRSIVAAVPIPKGVIIKEEMLLIKKPATGIAPKFLEEVIGKRAKQHIKEDYPLKWEWLE